MPRIRTIKPEFWTDEKIVQLSPLARLLYIGMWNFADDHGGIERSPAQLKMRILPVDSVNIHELLTELITHGFLIEYSVNNNNYLHIKKFKDHQRINRPSEPRYPPYNSVSTHCGKGSGSGSGMEEEGREEDRKGGDWGGKPGNISAVVGGNGLGAIPPPAPLSVDPEVIKLGEAIKRRREGEKLQ